ncbi:MAG: anti-sigma factor family protein [Gemmatimonadota bacterium]
MNNLNCEYVLDVYPDVQSGTLDPVQARQVQEHLASCDECRAHAELLDAVRDQAAVVPAGLHERVIRSALEPRPRLRFARGEIAMVAMLAAAVIGGSILMQSPQPQPAAPQESFGFVTVEDAMLTGKASLDDLTVAELEQLLKEIDS